MLITTVNTENTNKLSSREQEIFNMLLGGSTPKEIAYNLKIAYGTVITHQNNIYQKLGVHNINEFFVKFGSVANKPPPQKMNGILYWHPIGDKYSTYNLTVTNEEINGQTEECVIISGSMSEYVKAYSGANGIIEEGTLRAFKTMKSLSLKAIGDGNDYSVVFVTFDTMNGDHWFYQFPTVKNKIITVTFNVPNDLIRRGWSGKNVGFFQNRLTYIQIQTVNPGPYHLKFWDIRIN